MTESKGLGADASAKVSDLGGRLVGFLGHENQVQERHSQPRASHGQSKDSNDPLEQSPRLTGSCLDAAEDPIAHHNESVRTRRETAQPSSLPLSSSISDPKPSADALSEIDMDKLNAVLVHEMARNTTANYRAQWRVFVTWAANKGVHSLPADPTVIAAYLAERLEVHAHRPSTLRVAAAAIAHIHRAAGLNDPCSSLEVKRTLRSATRKVGRAQKQAEALTMEALAAIKATALAPRAGKGKRSESIDAAKKRGTVDIALVCLMRDAMLRVSEAAVLTWQDIQPGLDGTGRLLIRRSKTDAEGAGTVAYVSRTTMEALQNLKLLRSRVVAADSVIGLGSNQIAKRIKQAAQAAGLGGGFSGHSPRVGMARDLARVGIELPSLMTAGRWRTPAMPALYIRNEIAGRGAVAQFYDPRRKPN